MFSKKIKLEPESVLGSFTHCRLSFHSTGDYYVGTIAMICLGEEYFTILFYKLVRCLEFINDHRFGDKKWFSTNQYNHYLMKDFDLASMRNGIETNKYNGTELSWQFRTENGDEIFFTKDQREIATIEEVFNRTL